MHRAKFVIGIVVLLCAASWTQILTSQNKTWAAGSFELKSDVTWSKKKVSKGVYEFKVSQLTDTREVVRLQGKNGTHSFAAANSNAWVPDSKGLRKALVLHVEPDMSAEVAGMELAGPNLKLKFHCRHRKKDAVKPVVAVVMFSSYSN